jgi:hypothetical protein
VAVWVLYGFLRDGGRGWPVEELRVGHTELLRQFVRIALVTVAAVALFTVGTATAGVDLKTVILRPGKCMTLAKVRVCAAKARPRVTVTVTTTATPRVAFSDGTHRVGPDIVAGTYQSAATADSCYWERLRGFGGTLDDVIANYFGSSPTIVTIAPTDVGFRSSSCGGWTKIG